MAEQFSMLDIAGGEAIGVFLENTEIGIAQTFQFAGMYYCSKFGAAAMGVMPNGRKSVVAFEFSDTDGDMINGLPQVEYECGRSEVFCFVSPDEASSLLEESPDRSLVGVGIDNGSAVADALATFRRMDERERRRIPLVQASEMKITQTGTDGYESGKEFAATQTVGFHLDLTNMNPKGVGGQATFLSLTEGSIERLADEPLILPTGVSYPMDGSQVLMPQVVDLFRWFQDFKRHGLIAIDAASGLDDREQPDRVIDGVKVPKKVFELFDGGPEITRAKRYPQDRIDEIFGSND